MTQDMDFNHRMGEKTQDKAPITFSFLFSLFLFLNKNQNQCFIWDQIFKALTPKIKHLISPYFDRFEHQIFKPTISIN